MSELIMIAKEHMYSGNTYNVFINMNKEYTDQQLYEAWNIALFEINMEI